MSGPERNPADHARHIGTATARTQPGSRPMVKNRSGPALGRAIDAAVPREAVGRSVSAGLSLLCSGGQRPAGRLQWLLLCQRALPLDVPVQPHGVGFCWGHISSQDLVHWRHHPDAIGPGDGDEGCFSGGGSSTTTGPPTCPTGCSGATRASAWPRAATGITTVGKTRRQPGHPVDRMGHHRNTGEDGKPLVYGSADPTNIWKKGGKYYI